MALYTAERERPADPAAAYRLAALLLSTGTMHFLMPKPVDAMVPAALPGNPRLYTYASGVAELTTAALLLAPRTRRLGGLAAAALFVAIFPANVNMARRWRHKPLPLRIAAVARLPLQIPLITEALKVVRNSPRR